METLIIKKKEFEIVEKLGEHSYKVTRKGKEFFVKEFEVKSEKFFNHIYAASRVKSAMVLTPKIKLIDKKNGYIVSEYISGKTVLDYLLEHDPSDDDPLYRQIFLSTHMAKVNGLTLNCKPESWVITDKGLYYMRREFDIYSKEKDFTQTDIRLWFITKDLANYAKEHGYEFDNKRLKDEYLTNKHIVLVTCKFYQ